MIGIDDSAKVLLTLFKLDKTAGLGKQFARM